MQKIADVFGVHKSTVSQAVKVSDEGKNFA
jgi:hypothetical protein